MGSSYNVNVHRHSICEVLELSGSLPTHQPDLEPQLFVQYSSNTVNQPTMVDCTTKIDTQGLHSKRYNLRTRQANVEDFQ